MIVERWQEKLKIDLKKTETKPMIKLLLLLIPFFKPDIVVSFPKINIIFYGYLLVSLIIIIFTYIKGNYISKFSLIYICYYIITLFSTLINDGNLLKMNVDSLQNLGIILLIEMNLKGNKECFFKSLSFIFWILTIMNTISIFMFPNGIKITDITNTPIYLLGIDNRFAFVYLPGLCVITLKDMITKNKITFYTILYLAITYFTFIYFWSAGALLAETLLIIFYFIIFKTKIKINPKNFLLYDLIAFFGIVIFRMQNIFKYLIVDILKKDLTLSSRTLLWDKAINIIKDNYLIGIGVQKYTYILEKISAYHAHSYFLNIILQSGLVGFVLFIILIYMSLNNLNKFKNNRCSKIIAFTIFTMLIMLLVDTFDITCNMIMLLSLGYCVKEIVKENENE